MSMVRFATLCDHCGSRSEEYTSWPSCPECMEDLCPVCAGAGNECEDERARWKRACPECVAYAASVGEPHASDCPVWVKEPCNCHWKVHRMNTVTPDQSVAHNVRRFQERAIAIKQASEGHRCGRCPGVANTAIETADAFELVCASCANAVVWDHAGILAEARGPVANMIRRRWKHRASAPNTPEVNA